VKSITNKDIQNVLNYWIKKQASPGAACVMSNGEVILEAYSGVLHKNETPVDHNSIYDLASVTKLYTVFSIIKLQNERRLDIDDRVSKYLKTFRYSELTIRDLICHRANFGIRLSLFRKRYGSSFAKEIVNYNPPEKRSDFVHYENITYIYLGEIIKAVTKLNLQDYIKELLDDLKLENTKTHKNLNKIDITNLAPTEIIKNIPFKDDTHDESARLFGGFAGNAGLFSSASDLNKFGRIWIDNILINKDFLIKEVLSHQGSGTQKNSSICLGWWEGVPNTENILTRGIYSHTGFTGCLLAINPKRNSVLSLVCNRTILGRQNQVHRNMWRDLTELWINL